MQDQKVFKSIDSVHMLSFAALMLDIEINMDKVIEKGQLINDFFNNLKGLNDGLNYDSHFIQEIVNSIIDNPIIRLSRTIPYDKQYPFYIYQLDS